jgi:hypothetical protein
VQLPNGSYDKEEEMIIRWINGLSREVFWTLGAVLFTATFAGGFWFVMAALERGGDRAAWVVLGTALAITGALVTLIGKLNAR